MRMERIDENDRLDMTHHMMLLRTDGKLHLAPIGDHPQQILDIGTGTGIWAIEMVGDKYPSATILGNDLSPIQPTMVPPNVRFEVDDVEKPWLFDMAFDYIHCRYMATAISDWPGLVAQAYRFTKPGGWAEFQDFDLQYYSEDGSLKPEHQVLAWINNLLGASRKAGREPCPGPQLEKWMKDAGYKNIHHERLKLPIGTWPKDKYLKKLGAWNFMQIQEGLEAFTLRIFTKVLGWEVSEVQVMLALVKNDLRDPSIHAQFDFHVVYGQKPEAE
ncbi:hypothetical protein W97_04990 [Coniosporium apollinis CBS 100218]|uniref:S-adenosyl-L-methionine-dependent methyltransferase n=1 Tax=Coniosporium apollinis (strain CBS 100218) TaxID=1168221 RepID=R7YVR5_CONA1|nr:uncharacterized protein W97_04990 [Coniosporium apollinis CBS 100218]EON65751.1 hypothetical protein W97_04990 [Coniosporium apollinis CBS 100218]